MIPFHTRFPELGPRGTRCIHVLQSGGPLPADEYGFIEYHCEDPDCDCRRVLIRATTPQAPHIALATINYGWESAEYYTRWMHGDAQAGREIREASLDPLHPQSRYADHLLDCFREQLLTDPAYVARLARHYVQFKRDLHKHPAPGAAPRPAPPPPPPLTAADTLRQLSRVRDDADYAPYRAALLAAGQHREALVPELIAALDRVSAHPEDFLQDPDHVLHSFAIYLLAEFRETRALDAFLRFLSLPGGRALDLTGDMIAEQGGTILASVCGGDPAPLLRLVHDESVNPSVRVQAITALAVQNLWNERPREAVIADLRQLFHTLPKPGSAHVWAGLIRVIRDFRAIELAPEARQAFAQGWVEDTIVRLADLEADLAQPEDLSLDGFRARHTPINAADECSMWLCFRNENDGIALGNDEDDFDREEPPRDLRATSPRRRRVRSTLLRRPTSPSPKSAATTPAPAAAVRNTRSAAAGTGVAPPGRRGRRHLPRRPGSC